MSVQPIAREKISFAEVVKHGIKSFSPLKSANQNIEHSDGKKTKLGPQRLNLDDEDMMTMYEATQHRAQTADLPARSLAIGHYRNLKAKHYT